jgi:hypothetical protein
MYAENNEVATYSINGIGKPKSSGSSSSSRGVSMFHSNLSSSSSNGKLSSLNDIVTVYELEQDNEGNYTAKAWEWK